MNERIKQLAEQANAYELSHAYYRGEKKPENAVTLHSVDLELFAELIVKEMLQTCEDHPAWTGRMIGEEIKQHFGVEE